MSNQDRAEKVLADWADSEGGLTAIDEDYGGDMTGAAEALADAGLLMPDLPTDDTVGMSSGEWSAGFGYEDEEENTYQAHAYAWEPGKIGISAPKIMTTDQAEVLAHAILAAVKSDRKHTKRNQSNDNE